MRASDASPLLAGGASVVAGMRTVISRPMRAGPLCPRVPGRFPGPVPGSDDVAVLISELATNACVHSVSGTPGGRFTVRAEHCPGLCIHVEVEDQGSDWNGDLGTAEPPHGLYLLRELSSQCGTRRGDYGWVIWFTLAITT